MKKLFLFFLLYNFTMFSHWSVPDKIISLQDFKSKNPDKIYQIKFEADKKEKNPKFCYVAELDNARVFEDGIVITKNNELFADVVVTFSFAGAENLKKHHIFLFRDDVKTKKINGTVAVIASPGANCFYHWLLQILPRFELLKKSNLPYDFIYLMPCDLKFQKISLDLLGIDWTKIIFGTDNQQIIADKMLVPSIVVNKECHLPVWVQKFLQKNILQKCTKSFDFKRIFISRKLAASRRIINEDEMMQMLAKYGFEPICMENYDLTEQAQIMHNAEIIVAPHGSGLANLVFCKPGTQIVEIFNYQGFTQPFNALSKKLGLKHHSFFTYCDKLPNFKDDGLNSDIYVEINELEKLMNSLHNPLFNL